MAQRTWSIWWRINDGKITEYFVTDANDKEEISSRCTAVTFPVNAKFDEDLQKTRATQFADYLNKVDEATRIALEQNHLVDILSRP